MGFYEKLQSIVGADYVSDSPDVCRSYAYNTFITHRYSKPPEYVCQPQTTEQVSEVVKLCNQFKVPVTPKGLTAGTGNGGFHHGGVLLDLMYMDKILEVDPVNMKAVAEAGASFFKLSQEVFKAGMMLPTTEYSCGPSVAASVLTPVVAIGKTRYGRNCDLVEGFEVVLPTGEICRVGSMAYADTEFGPFYRYIHGPDLIGLFVMANGAMGIVTKVAYACQKKPPYWGYKGMYWTQEDIYRMQEYVMEVSAMEFYDVHVCDRWKTEMAVCDPTGTPHPELHPVLKDAPSEAFFLVYNTATAYSQEELDAKLNQLDRLRDKHQGHEMGPALMASMFTLFPSHHTPSVGSNKLMKPAYDMNRSNYHFIYDSINYPTSRLADVYLRIKESCEKYGFWGYPRCTVFDCFPMRSQTCCSQTWAYLNTRDEKQMEELFACREDFRDWFGQAGGTHQQHFYPIVGEYMWANQKSDYELLKVNKTAIDPNNIMSPATYELEV